MEAFARALVVDDLPQAREAVGERLNQVGFSISYAGDGLEALSVFASEPTDLIVTDRQMPRLDGLGLLRRVREISDVPVVLLTTFATIPDCEQAMRVGADRYLQFRHDLDRIGEIARELVGEGVSLDRETPAVGGITAAHARWIAQEERRAALERHLVECRGNIAEMARRMGKDRSTIRYHLRRFGMLAPEAQASSRSSARS